MSNTNRYYKWCEDDLINALLEYEKQERGINEISRMFQVPKPTILRHAKNKNKLANGNTTHKGRPTILLAQYEQELVNHLLHLERHMFGLTITNVRRLAFEVAEKHKINNNFNNDTKMAGKGWFYQFMRRHPELSIRQPESTSLNRAKGFNRENVNHFFKLLETIIDEHDIGATHIFNVDESGFSTVQKKPQKVIGQKGKKQIGSITSGERGVNTTGVCCVSAAGQYIPPMIIFKRMRMNPLLEYGAPPGSIVTVSETGYINTPLFVQWLKHFISVVKPTINNKVLLLLDGHTTHTKNLEALELATANGIIMVQLPGHTTHRLQPLDVTFFKPLSTFYIQAIEKWLRTNAGRQVTQYQVAGLFSEAYERAATIGNAINGFKSSGIWPVNRHIFPDHLFQAADALNAFPLELNNIENQPPIEPQPSSSGTQTIKESLLLLAPLPTNSSTKRRSVQQAVEITSNPHKKSLELSITKRNSLKTSSKTNIKETSGVATIKEIFKNKGKGIVKGRKSKRSFSKEESCKKIKIDDTIYDENECPLCGGNYFDKKGPNVDWIQCVRCHRWLHETCTNMPDMCENCLN